MPCLGAPLTLAVCEHFKGNYLRRRERGRALGKPTLAALLSQRKTNNIVRWVGRVCMCVQYAVAGVWRTRRKKKQHM